ncbi:hypothetical protein FOCC_FOCC013256 [Frankliniella occidentalis]|nr:hypothetical protein FOCC_FOCC013256 [Frankliniella occidentalis]
MNLQILTPCPFPFCDKKYSNVQSFSGHLTRNHANCVLSPDIALNLEAEEEEEEQLENGLVFDEMDKTDAGDSCLNDEESFLVTMSQFYMKLEFELFLPVSTVQYIVNELTILQTQNEELMKARLIKRLQEDGIPPERIESISKFVYSNNPIVSAQSNLKSDYLRKQIYKNTFDYVEPQKKPLPPKRGNARKVGRPRFLYQVPVPETVKKILKDKSINLAMSAPKFSDVEGLLKDFVDGSVFKSNQFFIDNPTGLQLILYQDAFELVVPIGPAKKKHKVLAVYLMIGNLPIHLRSHVNSIQLVALCLDKDFDHNAVYGPIVEELKLLETVGVFVEGHGVVKGSLVFIVGDNLGSHGAGGFVENFSKSIYFCRFCHVQRKDFFAPNGECTEASLRTATSYKNSLARLATSRKKAYQGIKYNSVFNNLKYFHVCSPGLSPCLAHDCFEGWVAYDLKLFIDYFVEKEWFSFDSLTEALSEFPFSLEDTRDKPIPVLASYERVKGGAWQICVFMRLLPLIIESKNIKIEKHDDVWKALLAMIEILEIILSPVIHESYLPYLQSCISFYLSSRRDLFPDVQLRPKHHYLSHASELIKCFGPLVRVFTLRFEAKHQFFKRAMKSSKNFINPLKSLAVRHELFQAFVRTGADFRCDIQLFGDSEFVINNYNEKIQHAVLHCNLNQSRECVRAIVKGTTYQKGNVVVIRQSGYQYQVELGGIVLIIYDNNDKLYLLFEKKKSEFVPHLRVYELHSTMSYECVCVDDLFSYQSLYVYKINGHQFVKLKHAVVCDRLE